MSDTIAFDDPQRVAVSYEMFEDDEGDSLEVGQWLQQHDTITATHIHYYEEVVTFENAEKIDPERTYPHCLRSTAATYHASRGLKAIQLQALLGWEEIQTAQKYVKLTGEHTARALRNVHNR